MNAHFLLEAVWVMFTYGWVSVASGLVISSFLVLRGSRRARRRARFATLGAAILILWVAMFIGVDAGYRAWQNIPNPPEEAFSDSGGPFVALFLGWLPSLVVLGGAHLLLRLRRKQKETPANK